MSQLPQMREQGLIALRGEGKGSGQPLGKLSVLPPSSASPSSVPAVLSAPKYQDTIICAGFDGVLAHSFFAMLNAFKVRCIVDIRLFPTFGKRGFCPDLTFARFSERHIDYFRVEALGNRFDIEFRDVRVGFAHHRQHLKTCGESLQWLREKIRGGPLVLLGSDAELQESDHKNVLDALLSAHPGFDICILAREDFHREDACQRFESLASAAPLPAAPRTPPLQLQPSPASPKSRQKAPVSPKQCKLFDL